MSNLSNVGFGQYKQYSFDNISPKDGLSQSTVLSIIQDQNGFLWFATFDGLNKYDGHSFKIYRKEPNNPASLSSNSLTYLHEDKDGYIWVMNNGNTGIDRLDPTTDKFQNFCHDPDDTTTISSNKISKITQDKEGNIWICADQTLNLYVPPKTGSIKPGNFIRYKINFPIEGFSWIVENHKGKLLLFSNYLFSFEKETEKFTNTYVEVDKSDINSIVEDSMHNLYLGSYGGGIIKLAYNEKTDSYEKVDPGKINITPNNRNTIFLDHNNDFWIGTELNGLYKYQPETDMMVHFMPNQFDNSTISDPSIYTLFRDNSGVLWIGTFSQGLDKYDFYHKPFLYFKNIPNNPNSLSGNVVSSIHGQDTNEIWVGLDAGGGINRIVFSKDEEPQIIRYLDKPVDENNKTGTSTLCLVVRKNGEVWAGNGGGIITSFTPSPPVSNEKLIMKTYKTDFWTFSIFEDSDGILWGGSWGSGLWQYNDTTDLFKIFYIDSENPHSLHDNVIWSLGEDNNKNLWIGGHGEGISILTKDQKKKSSPQFINFSNEKNNPSSLSHNTVNAIYQAQDNTIWIGTGGGLNKVISQQKITGKFDDFPNISFISYHISDGLPSEAIIGITEDKNGNLWLSTSNGISKFDPVNEQFTNYDENHGIQSNEFWHNAYFKNSDGMIFFGGKNGISAFYPEEIIPNPFLPKVLLTEIKLFNKTVEVGDTINKQVVLEKPIYKTDVLILKYKNNIITFQYAALHFAQPSQNKYAYYLEGFENDWNYVNNRNDVTYTNLDPGKYTFRVKASNNDGIWSEEEVALKVIITPPWWKSLAFKIITPIILAMMVLAFFRIRLRILSQQKKLLLETIDIRTDELIQANKLLEERQHEIQSQNDELLRHRNDLEGLVIERTSELERAKEKAEESDRLKSSFLANMSHEIRTPMNAILGFSTLLKDDKFTEEEKEGFVQAINANGESLLVIIDDILDISIIESNQMVFKHIDINIHSILTELEDYYKLKNVSHLEIEFVNKNEPDLIMYLDPVRFRQIMNNLLNNALKYTHEGYIKFGYRKQKNEICFFVSDSGIGIDPNQSEYIFDHFYKIELQSNKLYGGTGIGLAICKKLVELLKGRIWLESKPDVGSTFYFTLPLKSHIQTTQNEDLVSKSELLMERLFFLIAEDEPTNYLVMLKLLGIKQDNHFWAKNGREAVEYIKELKDHSNIIVLMDIKMPVMDGHKAMKLIKNINRNIPVIAVTAFALKHEEKDLLSRGFDDYMAKPINAEKLKEIIIKSFGDQNQ